MAKTKLGLLQSYSSELILLLDFRRGRTAGSPFTVSIRQIDGNHIQEVLLAKEDLDAILESGAKNAKGE